MTSESVRAAREKAWQRQGGRCFYCGRYVPREKATFDHKLPRARGGGVKNNGAMSCWACNNRKGDMTAEEFKALCFDPAADPDPRPRISAARLRLWAKADSLSATG